MHLEAKKKYRLRRAGKLVRIETTIVNENKRDYDERHQQWLKDLDEFENKPIEQPTLIVSQTASKPCTCGRAARYCRAIFGDDI